MLIIYVLFLYLVYKDTLSGIQLLRNTAIGDDLVQECNQILFVFETGILQ